METNGEKYELVYLSEASEEYQKLDGTEKIFVDKGLQRIMILGMQAGQPLPGSLIKCHKLKNKRMGLRIVFRQENREIMIIQIIAIGKRADKKVYQDAVRRLDKLR